MEIVQYCDQWGCFLVSKVQISGSPFSPTFYVIHLIAWMYLETRGIVNFRTVESWNPSSKVSEF
jgi:hypothetical protein